MENKLIRAGQNSLMDNFVKTDDILKDMCGIIESSQKAAHQAVNAALVQRNWLIGYRIAEEEIQGEDRAKYGAEIIKKLSKELTAEYGKGFTKTNLYSFYSFYKTFPEIFHSLSGKSVQLLSWTHYRALLQVHDDKARAWYEKEALEQGWSVRTLQRNISSQYYYRMLQTQKPELVEKEMMEIIQPLGLCCVLKQMRTSPDTLFFMGMSSCSHPNISCICRLKKNCGQKLKIRKQYFIFNSKRKNTNNKKRSGNFSLPRFYNTYLYCSI